MYVQWRGMIFVDTRRADRANRNTDDSVAKCLEQTAAPCDGLETVQGMQRLQKAFNETERSGSYKGDMFREGMHGIA
jgi:hypothetical protein